MKGEYRKGQPLTHMAFTVGDLYAAEEVVKCHGLKPFGHDDYEFGRRF